MSMCKTVHMDDCRAALVVSGSELGLRERKCARYQACLFLIYGKKDVESKNKETSSFTYLITISVRTLWTTCNSPQISLSARIPPFLRFPIVFFPSTMFSYLLLSSFLCCLSGIRHLIVTGARANRPVNNAETLYSYCPKQKQQV